MENGKHKSSKKRSKPLEQLKDYFDSTEFLNDSDSSEIPEPAEEKTREGLISAGPIPTQDIIFKPFRAIGLVCDSLGFVYHRNIPEKQFTVTVGHGFQTYSVDGLRLVYVSPHIARRIASVAVYKDFVLTASRNEVEVWLKTHSRKKLTEHKAEVVSLLVAGDTLISLDTKGKAITWELPSCAKLGEIQVQGKSMMLHPPTYLFKVLFAGGRELELWNVNSLKRIYDFPAIRALFDSGVTALEESVVLDVVGIGLASGRILVANIRTDKVLLQFNSCSRVNSLSFSHPESALEYSLLAAGTSAGDVVFFDLNTRRVHTSVKAHNGKGVDKVSFVPGEPLLISSSGDDNSLKVWIFDKGQIKPRVLRSREGADGAARCIRFYGDEGKDLLAACGENALLQRVSLTGDHQNVIFATGGRVKEATRALSFSKYRELDWSNVVTCHYDSPECHLWSYERKALQPKVKLETHNKTNATMVQVTNCGNFCIIGYSDGELCKLNMQSGLHRGCFKNSHTAPITGIGIDQVNKFMVSAGLDGKISFWDFYSRGLVSVVDVETPVEAFVYEARGGLAGLVGANGQLQVLDAKTRKIVRNFGVVHDSKVTGICFSSDGKWLVSAAGDNSLKVWDIMLGILINWLVLPKAITCLDFSPTGDYLATGLVGEKGIFLWSNAALYSHLTLNKSPTQPAQLDLPRFEEVVQGKSRKEFYHSKEEATEAMTDDEEWKTLLKGAEETKESTINFSSEPFTKWQTIYNLESIKEKNKPIEPPKDPPPVPFFLYDIDKESENVLEYKNLLIDQEENEDARRRILKKEATPEIENELIKLLRELKEEKSTREEVYAGITLHLKGISGSRSEVEFGQLNSLTGEYKEEAAMCLDYFAHAISQKQDYELLQAHLHVFLKNCADILQQAENEEKVKEVFKAQKRTWESMQRDLTNSMFLVDFFSGIQLV
eukprot:TRINITY_DN2598_c0_g4_i3.p1 TRINITY_DN2598_c0_g4~~TRINITY_DN2598_c0_g4_i3.p1  ORF type:complete len:946 (-),score=217.79 TRINITY_DN2598_c0_g4_i3:106-2943(-)